jgi:hypothetical protein
MRWQEIKQQPANHGHTISGYLHKGHLDGGGSMNALEQAFLNLCREAYDQEEKGGDWHDVEPAMVSLLALVRENPASRGLFIRLFGEIDDGLYPAPHYLLAFCMHELRYPEIKKKIKREFDLDPHSVRNVRRMNYISKIMGAYDDDWEDADMWLYYEQKATTDPEESSR